MGLDQYAGARKGEPVEEDGGTSTWTDEDGKECVEHHIELYWPDQHDICEWRCHPNLQGWMQAKWEKKGCPRRDDESVGEGDLCYIDLVLEKNDLLELQEAITNAELPPTTGFFR